jgi:hypothetical protein
MADDKEVKPEEEIPSDEVEEYLESYLDPLVTCDYIVTNMDILSGIEFDGKEDCINDLASILKKCNDLISLQLTTQLKELKKANKAKGL